jgi:hypothetical protein
MARARLCSDGFFSAAFFRLFLIIGIHACILEELFSWLKLPVKKCVESRFPIRGRISHALSSKSNKPFIFGRGVIRRMGAFSSYGGLRRT